MYSFFYLLCRCIFKKMSKVDKKKKKNADHWQKNIFLQWSASYTSIRWFNFDDLKQLKYYEIDFDLKIR